MPKVPKVKNTEFQSLMIELVECGCSDTAIAKKLNMSEKQFDTYLGKHAAFCIKFDSARMRATADRTKALDKMLRDQIETGKVPPAIQLKLMEDDGVISKGDDKVTIETPDLSIVFGDVK